MGWELQGVDQRIWVDRLNTENRYWNNEINATGRGYMPRPTMQPRIFPTVEAQRVLVGYEIKPNHPKKRREQNNRDCDRDLWAVGAGVRSTATCHFLHTQYYIKD